MNAVLAILTGGTAEFTVQRSRFIAYASAVSDEADARAFLARIRKAHYDARHCCSAWVLGADGALQKSNDDGEPGGTAGAPILEALKRRALTDAALAVVRYFGGIKLGAGGLTRAYAHAAKLGLDASALARRVSLRRVLVTVGYERLAPLERLARAQGIASEPPVYAEAVAIPFLVAPDACGAFERAIADLTGGQARFEPGSLTEQLIPLDPPNAGGEAQ